MQTIITNEELQAARVYAAKVHRDAAANAFSPDFGFASHVTDEDKQVFVGQQLKLAEEIEAGHKDGNFTVWQRMHYYLTGESVPFLSK